MRTCSLLADGYHLSSPATIGSSHPSLSFRIKLESLRITHEASFTCELMAHAFQYALAVGI